MAAGFYQGLCPFRRYNRLVHWVGYLSGFSVWTAGYVVVATIVPDVTLLSILIAMGAASALCGVYMGRLFLAGIGSPGVNLCLPAIAPFLAPHRFHDSFIGSVPETDIVLLATAAVAGIGGLYAAIGTLNRRYPLIDDPVAWEESVMPHAVRFYDDDLSPDLDQIAHHNRPTRPPINPRITDWSTFRFDRRGAVIGCLVTAPVLAVAMYGVETYDDLGSQVLMLLGIFFLLHNSLTLGSESASA